MNKYGVKKELYKQMITTELCNALKNLWKFEFLSEEWKIRDDRCEELKRILAELEGE